MHDIHVFTSYIQIYIPFLLGKEVRVKLMKEGIRIFRSRGCEALNVLTVVGMLRALTDFNLSNARRFYSSMGNPSAVKGLGNPDPSIKALTTFEGMTAQK